MTFDLQARIYLLFAIFALVSIILYGLGRIAFFGVSLFFTGLLLGVIVSTEVAVRVHKDIIARIPPCPCCGREMSWRVLKDASGEGDVQGFFCGYNDCVLSATKVSRVAVEMIQELRAKPGKKVK